MYQPKPMQNKRMEERLEKGEAIDLSEAKRIGRYYVIDPADVQRVRDGVDLCDAAREAWIWSAGIVHGLTSFTENDVVHLIPPGTVLASLSSDLYQREGVECIWLR